MFLLARRASEGCSPPSLARRANRRAAKRVLDARHALASAPSAAQKRLGEVASRLAGCSQRPVHQPLLSERGSFVSRHSPGHARARLAWAGLVLCAGGLIALCCAKAGADGATPERRPGA